MKKIAKLLMATMLVAALVISLAACGALDINKVKGDWVLKTIDGKTVEDYAAGLNAEANLYKSGLTITDKDITNTNANGSTTYKIAVLSNGIEGKDDSGKTVLALVYDDAKKTLTMKAGADEATAIAFVYEQGKVSFDAPQTNEGEQNGEAEGGEAEGGEQAGEAEGEEAAE